MSQYLLSMHTGEAPSTPPEPMSPEVMQEFMGRVNALEADMKSSGAFVFTGALHGPDATTVVRRTDGELVMTDGPYVEAKEHIGGFYVINADDLDVALTWAGKVVDAIGHAIEVRPFRDHGGS